MHLRDVFCNYLICFSRGNILPIQFLSLFFGKCPSQFHRMGRVKFGIKNKISLRKGTMRMWFIWIIVIYMNHYNFRVVRNMHLFKYCNYFTVHKCNNSMPDGKLVLLYGTLFCTTRTAKCGFELFDLMILMWTFSWDKSPSTMYENAKEPVSLEFPGYGGTLALAFAIPHITG